MPQYAILIFSDTTAEHDAAELAEHDEHADDLIRSGALTAAYALRSPAAARSIRGSGITDGPYDHLAKPVLSDTSTSVAVQPNPQTGVSAVEVLRVVDYLGPLHHGVPKGGQDSGDGLVGCEAGRSGGGLRPVPATCEAERGH